MERWVAIFTASPGEVGLARSRLEAAGIPCYVPAEFMKTLDPLDTGGQIFDFDLMVPRSAADLAKGLLQCSTEDIEPQPGEIDLPPDFFEVEPAEERKNALLARCMSLSRRIRWAALSFVGAPFGIAQAWSYFEAAGRLDRPPPNHHSTVVAIGLCFVQILLMVLYFVVIRRSS